MNKSVEELLERVNSIGRVLGYPLFVMEGGQILKTPPQDVPFKMIVWGEINVHKSLNNQKIMSYSEWLAQTSMPRSVHQCKFEEKYNISHLKPKLYQTKHSKVYVYKEPGIFYFAKIVPSNSFLAAVLDQPQECDGFYIAPLNNDKVEVCHVNEQGNNEIYYYLY